MGFSQFHLPHCQTNDVTHSLSITIPLFLCTRTLHQMALEPWERGECIAHIPKSMASNSPGPAYYHISRTFKNKVPVILMKGRTFLRPDQIDAPYLNFPSLIGQVTKVGLHGRTDLKNKFNPPGPNYSPPRFGSDGHKIGIAAPGVPTGKARTVEGAQTAIDGRRNPDETVGPGPGKYSLRSHDFDGDGNAGCSVKGFHDFSYHNTISPGPAAYRPRYEAILRTSPKVSFHDRPKDRGAPATPGYRNLGSTLGGHKFTMKARAVDNIAVI
jgi:hypothetical protein